MSEGFDHSLSRVIKYVRNFGLYKLEIFFFVFFGILNVFKHTFVKKSSFELMDKSVFHLKAGK